MTKFIIPLIVLALIIGAGIFVAVVLEQWKRSG